MSTIKQKTPIYRHDYRPPDFWVRDVTLDVDIGSDEVQITATLAVEKNTEASDSSALLLQGRGQRLLSVEVNGRLLAAEDYELSDTELRIPDFPERAQLTIVSSNNPDNNSSLEGFYRSGNILCTQCEAHGFSRISYFPDRPDILATYRVTLTADQQRYPLLLANGNLVSQSTEADGRHTVTWQDPYPKPCYLFAMVAGDLACVEDSYCTRSGRQIDIKFYVESGDEGLCDQAIASLKAAMAWDEATYNLEYDLDLYMVVAVGSFNMGAMENKGLNIFNSRFVLANTETATDTDFELVQAVIGHEYFHNWTGNRVTCRDWFQLSLKEGLTVFREQQFMESSLASSTQRIEHVRMLRSQQFAEDASPMAHPVRPDSYIEMNNFYTLTVYEKGSELIRMMRGLMGQEAFSTAIQHYLQKFDGTAATIDDFIEALSESSGLDLSDFLTWYSQAGTPVLKISDRYDTATREYHLEFAQHTPDSSEQKNKSAVPIPVRMSLLASSGEALTLDQSASTETTVLVSQASQQQKFGPYAEKPVPVFLRDFSAPVKLEYLYSRDDLQLIARHENDGFSRWDAMQRLYRDLIDEQLMTGTTDIAGIADLGRHFLAQASQDYALAAELLRLPGEAILAQSYEPVPVAELLKARDGCENELATKLASDLLDAYGKLSDVRPYVFNGTEAGQRRLKNLALYYLAANGGDGPDLALQQFQQANNMTDRLAALEALNHIDCEQRQQTMDAFAVQWQNNALVMDKWLALQATSRLPGALQRVQQIRMSKTFDDRNPNRMRALVGSFCMQNMRGFHQADGAAYAWLAEEIKRLDDINPQVASRLCTPLCRWQQYASPLAEKMQQALRDIAAKKGLSADVYEVVSRALG